MRVWSSSHWNQGETFHGFKWDCSEASSHNQTLQICCYWQWLRRRTQLVLRCKDVVVKPWVKKNHFACKSTSFDIGSSEEHGWISKHFFSAQHRISGNQHEDFYFHGQPMGQFSDHDMFLTGGWTRLTFQPKLFCNFQCWGIKILSIEVKV